MLLSLFGRCLDVGFFLYVHCIYIHVHVCTCIYSQKVADLCSTQICVSVTIHTLRYWTVLEFIPRLTSGLARWQWMLWSMMRSVPQHDMCMCMHVHVYSNVTMMHLAVELVIELPVYIVYSSVQSGTFESYLNFSQKCCLPSISVTFYCISNICTHTCCMHCHLLHKSTSLCSDWGRESPECSCGGYPAHS